MSKLSSQRRRRAYPSFRENWSDEESDASVSVSSSPPSIQNRSLSEDDFSDNEEIRSVTNQIASSGLRDPEEPPEKPWEESAEPGIVNGPINRNSFSKTSENRSGSIVRKDSGGKSKFRVDPAFTPKSGHFWLHDDRFAPEVGGMGGFRSDRIERDREQRFFEEKDFKDQRDDRESGNKPTRGDSHGLRGSRSRGFNAARAGFAGRGSRGGLRNLSPVRFLTDSRKKETWNEASSLDPTNNKWAHDKFEEIQKDRKYSTPDSDRRKSWAPASQPLRERSQRTPHSLEKKKSTPAMQFSSPEASLGRNSPDSTRSPLYRSSSQSHSRKDLTREIHNQTSQTEESNFNNRQASNPLRGASNIRGRFGSISKRGGNNQFNSSSKVQAFTLNEFKDEFDQMNENFQKFPQSNTVTSTNTNDDLTQPPSKLSKRYLSTKLTNGIPSSTQISEKPPTISYDAKPEENWKSSNFLKKAINAPEFQPLTSSPPQYVIDPALNLNSLTALGPPFSSQTRQTVQPFLTSSGYLILMTENGYILPPNASEYQEQLQHTQLYFPYPQYASMEYYEAYETTFYENPPVDEPVQKNDKEFFFPAYVREQQMDDELWVTDGVPDWETLKQYEVDYEAIDKGLIGERWKEKEDEWDSDGSDIEVILEKKRS
ncbi:hypothetical protein HK096_004336 [Nowakowskiella sp. JEL0078]|nr:hypothetical protein HK096_004336 [Nowakowskiella sp. JEL0078]